MDQDGWSAIQIQVQKMVEMTRQKKEKKEEKEINKPSAIIPPNPLPPLPYPLSPPLPPPLSSPSAPSLTITKMINSNPSPNSNPNSNINSNPNPQTNANTNPTSDNTPIILIQESKTLANTTTIPNSNPNPNCNPNPNTNPTPTPHHDLILTQKFKITSRTITTPGFITTDQGKFSLRQIRANTKQIFDYRENEDVYTHTDKSFFKANISSG
jgi:hypothetical protein